MAEIDLLARYPGSERAIDERAAARTDKDVAIAKRFDREYFDGPRTQGYGGYSYHERFWTGVVRDFIRHYGLTNGSSILDVGCGKGFMLHDFRRFLPHAALRGIDISEYAIENAMEDIRPFVTTGNAMDLRAFRDKEFGLVISINTVHNLELRECKAALAEIERVGRKAFITVDAWRDEEEKERMLKWNLTAETFMHADDWKKVFSDAGYTGDYFWFIAG